MIKRLTTQFALFKKIQAIRCLYFFKNIADIFKRFNDVPNTNSKLFQIYISNASIHFHFAY